MTQERQSTAPAPPPRELARRSPAMPVAGAAALGVVLDRGFCLGLPYWIVPGLLLVLGAFLAQRRHRPGLGVALLLPAVSLAGGAWHHVRWSSMGPAEVSRFATDLAQPVRLVGWLADQPVVVPRRAQDLPSPVPQLDRTVGTLVCGALISGDNVLPVTGKVRLEVVGHLPHAFAGDQVDVVGRFYRPREPDNPGAFDFRDFLRRSAIFAVVRCAEPEDVRLVARGGAAWKGRQAAVRGYCEDLLASHLSPRTAPVGIALLLGTRTNIPEDLRLAFAESGTMHILAISGANVGILAGLIWFCARLLGLRRNGTLAAVLLGVLGYAFLADAQPPVMRAVLMLVAALAGRPWRRESTAGNALALALLGLLAWNPSHLFDVGAQLSFLAATALVWAPLLRPLVGRLLIADADVPVVRPQPWPRAAGRWVVRAFVALTLSLGAIWLFTLPLSMARFHLLSPVGFAVNVLLAPLVVVVLWSGYALLLVGLFVPALVAPFGLAFDHGLSLLLAVVEGAARVPLGHFYLPGPSDGWLAGYYACLLAVVLGAPGHWQCRVAWRVMLGWVVVGLAAPLLSHRPDALRVTFLSLGDGQAVMIEFPNGRVALYDPGQLENGNRARQVVQSALWAQGRASIDALVLSHPDVDQFNAVPGLARTMNIGQAFLHSSFLDLRRAPVARTVDTLAEREIPIRLVWAGDRLAIDPRVEVRVLHPDRGERHDDDNANSLVLRLTYGGRSILLAGDLDGRGRGALLRRAEGNVDLLLAPRRGALAANTRKLAQWANPEWVVVSGGRQESLPALQSTYRQARALLATNVHGAVAFTFHPDGAVHWQATRP